ncbi:MAG: PilZ domain-containing protein [Acidobacteriota bacterium]
MSRPTKEKRVNFTSTSLPEEGFNLPLPMNVEGVDSEGNNFNEETTLSYISHYGSSFWLSCSVPLGKELRLSINLPTKLSRDKPLQLIIRGEVIFIEKPKDASDRNRISLKFKNKYIISEKQ